MKAATGWRIEDSIKAALPTLSAMLCVTFSAVPFGIPQLSAVMPWLGLMPIYYWSIHEPRYMPYWVAFMVGFWQDALTGGPLGLFALIFVVVRHLVVGQRLVFYRKAFMVGWWGFALVTIFAAIFGWAVASFYFDVAMPVASFAGQAALTVMVYPLIAWALGGVWLVVSD